jgi:hypothetical protein
MIEILDRGAEPIERDDLRVVVPSKESPLTIAAVIQLCVDLSLNLGARDKASG